MPKRIYCKYCGKKLKKKKRGMKKIFCNGSCSQTWRYHNIPKVNRRVKQKAKEQFRREKGDPKKRIKHKKYFDMWRKKNKEKFNTSMRNAMRKRLGIKPEEYRKPLA